jgi:hypothetical protein
MGVLDSIKDNFTNSSFEIDETMLIVELTKKFKTSFGCSLRVYKGNAIANGALTIKALDARTRTTIKHDAEKLKIKASEKVGEVENKFMEHFGLKVQIADKNNKKLVPNEVTLGEASRL